MANVMRSLVHLTPPRFSRMHVQRFSPYFERPGEFGLELTGPMRFYRYLYDVPDEALANISYDYEHAYADGRDPASYVGGAEEAVAFWREAAANGGFGSLVARRGPGFLRIEDRRPGLERADYHFDEIEARIYLACDAGATVASIRAALAEAGFEPPDPLELEQYLDELVAARLMYRENHQFLSLALAAGRMAAEPAPVTIATASMSAAAAAS